MLCSIYWMKYYAIVLHYLGRPICTLTFSCITMCLNDEDLYLDSL